MNDNAPITSRLKKIVSPLDCSSSWAFTPVCTGKMGLPGAGVVGLVAAAVECRVTLLYLSVVSFDLLEEESEDDRYEDNFQAKMTT